jgi:TolB-like protein
MIMTSKHGSFGFSRPFIRIVLFIALLLFGAGSPCFAQNARPFDEALKEVLTYLTGRMPSGSTVAILSFQSEHPDLSEYIIDDITSGLVNTDLYTVVDRRSLEVLAQEMAFQLSGEVSDDTALAIGRRLGAQTVISGAITYLGDFYRLRVQAIEVESARIQGSQIVAIQPNRMLATLTGRPWTGPAEPVAAAPLYVEPPAPTEPAKPPAPARVSNTRRFYMGLRGGFSAHLYYPDPDYWDYPDGDMSYPSFVPEAAAQMSLQLASFLAVQAEAVFLSADDAFEIDRGNTTTLSYSAMMFPVLGKLTLRPGPVLLAAFGGVFFTVPYTAMTFTVNGTDYSYKFDPPMGWIAGVNIGVKAGAGTLFLDMRYAEDLDDITLTGDWGSQAVYKRRMVFVSLGYEFGFGGGRGR